MTAIAPQMVRPGNLRQLLPLALSVLLVLTAIAYPLTSGPPRNVVTWTLVLLGAAVSVTHAWLSRGARVGAGVLVLVAGRRHAPMWCSSVHSTRTAAARPPAASCVM